MQVDVGSIPRLSKVGSADELDKSDDDVFPGDCPVGRSHHARLRKGIRSSVVKKLEGSPPNKNAGMTTRRRSSQERLGSVEISPVKLPFQAKEEDTPNISDGDAAFMVDWRKEEPFHAIIK